MNKLFAGLGSVRMIKNCDLGHSLLLYGLPSRQITYICSLGTYRDLSIGKPYRRHVGL